MLVGESEKLMVPAAPHLAATCDVLKSCPFRRSPTKYIFYAAYVPYSKYLERVTFRRQIDGSFFYMMIYIQYVVQLYILTGRTAIV